MIGSLGRSFAWLNATQFLGALNDNVFKLLLVNYLIAASAGGSAGGVGGMATLLFALPFLLFTPFAGAWADRSSKRDIVVWMKVLEIAVMLLGVWAFARGSTAGLYAALFLMSLQSALFGPSKYGIIPELVERNQLSRANGQLVMMTYLAIIFGTVLGPQLTVWLDGRYAIAAAACVVIAIAGTLTSLGIGRTPATGRPLRFPLLFWTPATRTLREFRHDRPLIVSMWGYAYFSVVGAFLQIAVIQFGMERLGYSSVESTRLFLFPALGIAAGGWLAGRWSGRNIEFGIVPVGALLISFSCLGLALGAHSLPMVGIGLFLAGIGSGLYVVPLESFLQWRSPDDRRGEVVAAGGFLSWVGVFLGGLLCKVLFDVTGWTAAQGLVLLGAMTFLLGACSLKILPDFFIRFIALLLTRSLYRIRTIGLDHLPSEGGGLLVSNHVSFMDALHILAVQQRRIRFLMHRSIYEKSRLRPLFDLMGVIPIAMEDPPKRIIESLRAAREAMDAGYLVCIFAEGALTRNGLMQGFRPGLERIVKGSAYPIIPVYLGGTWGSIFSYYFGRQHARPPVRFPYPVTVIFGAPLSATVKAWEVRQAVSELACTYFEDRRTHRRSLGELLVATARRNRRHPAMSDTSGKELKYGRMLVAALALSRVLRRKTPGESTLGVLIPPSVGGALVNLALALLGRTTVNLNFTASRDAFQSAIRQSGLRTIVTSRAFLEKMPDFATLDGLLPIEDVVAAIRPGDRIVALLESWLRPVRSWRPSGFTPDATATILFSSGTTGEPKGVMLSHHNIASNVESISMVFRPRREDVLCACLPLFHSFGYTAGLWFPLLSGMAASYHVSPLDAGKVAEVVRTRRCTALFATPTFLLAYLRKASREDFATLRHLVVGAEKLKPRLADAFEEKFGIRPREGYGATELSPVATLSLPDTDLAGVFQAGSREGSVGQAVPGVAVRIVDPDTHVLLPPGQPGLMLIRGPNVMTGYLNQPQKTAEVLKDGWYVTGDIATMDEDGFVTITDRLSRFSKIAGEMVPHLAIEEEYLKGLKTTEPVLAVVSVPCERKGERLVVLYTAAAGAPDVLHGIIEAAPIPNLWKPAAANYYAIEALPLTGSGKLDVKTLRQQALEKSGTGG